MDIEDVSGVTVTRIEGPQELFTVDCPSCDTSINNYLIAAWSGSPMRNIRCHECSQRLVFGAIPVDG